MSVRVVQVAVYDPKRPLQPSEMATFDVVICTIEACTKIQVLLDQKINKHELVC